MKSCTRKITVDSMKNCYVLPNGIKPLEQTAATLELKPGIHVIRISKGTFSYFADGKEARSSVLLWIAGGKFTHNASKKPISAGWACLNGDDDTCTIDVAATTKVHALFLDTYRDDNQGKIELAVLSDDAVACPDENMPSGSVMRKYSNAMWAQILSKFTAKELAESRRQFNIFDVNQSGEIDIADLESLAKSLGMQIAAKELMSMVSICDFDQSGTISFAEFLQMVFAVNFGEGQQQFAEIYRKATGAEFTPWEAIPLTYTPEEVEAVLKEFPWFRKAEEGARATEPEAGDYPKFIWQEELHGVGYPHIDAQHQKLFQIVDNFETILRHNGHDIQLANALDELIDYTDYHFKAEEVEMESYNYPLKDAHGKIHQAFKEKMIASAADLKCKLAENEADLVDRRTVWEMTYFLRNWLVNHIQQEDTAFGRYCQKARQAS